MWKIVAPHFPRSLSWYSFRFLSFFPSFSVCLFFLFGFLAFCCLVWRRDKGRVLFRSETFGSSSWFCCVFHFLQTNSFVTLCECLVFICGLNRTETFEKKSNGRKRNNQIYLVERSILVFFCCCLIHKCMLDPLIRWHIHYILGPSWTMHVLVKVVRTKGAARGRDSAKKMRANCIFSSEQKADIIFIVVKAE